MEKIEERDVRVAMVETLMQAVEDGTNLAVLVSDSTSTSKIAPFQEKYPERLVNVGIAEQNLIGIAAGLSLGGYIPVTANAAPFLVARSNEQVKNDVCYSNTNVKLVGLNAGVSYGALASTHHAIDDVSIMRGLGNIQILAPSDSVETAQIFKYALAHEGPVYIRMDGTLPVLHDHDYQFEPGKVDVLRQGNDVTIIALGSVVHEAVAAAHELDAASSIHAEVLNISSVRPLQRQGIIESLRKTKKAITVEEHSLHGGIGSLVSEIIAEEQLNVEYARLGFPEGQFSKAGPRTEIRAYYKIDTQGIVETAKQLLHC